MTSVACVTCASIPEPDPDEALLHDALTRLGVSVAVAAWDDPSVDWARFDLCVPRSTWNYYEDRAAFLELRDLVCAVPIPRNVAAYAVLLCGSSRPGFRRTESSIATFPMSCSTELIPIVLTNVGLIRSRNRGSRRSATARRVE